MDNNLNSLHNIDALGKSLTIKKDIFRSSSESLLPMQLVSPDPVNLDS